MLDKLDDLIKRFVAVFLFPLINILVMISITYAATNTDTNKMSSVVGSIFTNALTASTQFIQTNLSTVSIALKDYGGAVQTLASASAAALFFIVVLAIYLIDRGVYFFGRFMPPNFDFDLQSYDASKGKSRTKALHEIFTTDCNVTKCYGAIRAYLGQKNSDPYRIGHRNRLIQRLETARTVFAYTKAYMMYLLIVGISSFWGAGIATLGASTTFFMLLVVLVLTVKYLSFIHRTLVDYDLNSFIWERSYSAETPPKIEAVSLLSDVIVPPKTRIGRMFRERLNLRMVLLDSEV